MIKVSRLNGEEYVLNSSLIETVEANPDTVISLTTGHKLVVRESVDEIIDKVITIKFIIFSSKIDKILINNLRHAIRRYFYSLYTK